MKTYKVIEAAKVLHCHADTLRAKAHSGEIPAKKICGKWIFEEELLRDWMRGEYATPAHKQGGKNNEEVACHSTNVVPFGGSISQRQTANAYNEALKPKTAKPRKNTTTKSSMNRGR